MKSVFKYVVCALLVFNSLTAKAAGVELDLSPEEEQTIDTSFKGRLDLPAPVFLRQSLDETKGSASKLLLLGGYFHLRYPDEAINTDLSGDIAQIFPELTQSEAKSRAFFIQNGVRLYRWGMEEYTKIKEKLLAPSSPPILYRDSDYVTPDTEPYLETEPNTFAIKYDFKKVVPYSGNPRDLEAMRVKKQHDATAKALKTDYDQFKSMVDQIELSKLPFYGLTIPDPLVGNAGTTPWEERDSFRVRLLAEITQYHNKSSFLGGVHIQIPNHRFILGTGPDKPIIENIASENIASFETFLPMPDQFVSEELIGGYSGDLLFPFKITPLRPDESISIRVRLTFQNCDPRLNCQPMSFEQTLVLEAGSYDSVSSFQNFIRQSYHNLPKPAEAVKKLKLESLKADRNADNMTDRLNLVFKRTGEIRNFYVFIEDARNTRFGAPKVSMDSKRIYATFPILDQSSFDRGDQITVTAQLNSFVRLRTTIPVTADTSSQMPRPIFYTFISAFLFGICSWLTPIGAALFLLMFKISPRLKRGLIYRHSVYGLICGICLMFSAIYYLKRHEVFVYWGLQYQTISYMFIVATLCLIIKQFILHPTAFTRTMHPYAVFLIGLCFALITPVAYGFGTAQTFANALQENSFSGSALILLCYAGGLSLPTLVVRRRKTAAILYRYELSWTKAACRLLLLQIGLLLITVALQIPFKESLFLFFVWLIESLFIYFIFAFDQGLSLTNLPSRHKRIAERIVLCLGVISLYATTTFLPHIQKVESSQSAQAILEKAQQEAHNGRLVLVRMTADWCLLCRVADILTFNNKNILRWQALYRPIFETIDMTFPDKSALDVLQKYGEPSPPITLLYGYMADEGITLSYFPTSAYVSNMLKTFAFSR